MKQTKSPKEIAEELVEERRQPFKAFGKDYQGDIFYSDIHRLTEGMAAQAFNEIVSILEAEGYYVHS